MNKEQWKAQHRRRRILKRWQRANPYEIALKIRWMEMLIKTDWEELHGWGNPIPLEEIEKKMKKAAQRPENWFLQGKPK